MINDFATALTNRSFHKLIIGAALKDFKQIENFSYLFTHAEVNALDISAFPHSVINAKAGIERAQRENLDLKEPLIMVSVNIAEDPHFRRIVLDESNCTECLACIPSCPADAFYLVEEKFTYNIDLCFGCSACLPSCDFDALAFDNWNSGSPNSLQELIKLGANAIEIHLNNDLELFKNFYMQLPKQFALESFCIGSEKMTEADLRQATLMIIAAVKEKYGAVYSPFIIQTDGIPLSGARLAADTEKDLVSINNAKIVLETINSYFPELSELVAVQLAGGTTEHSLAKAFELGIPVNGVAIGSYARRLISLAEQDSMLIATGLINKSKSLEKIIKK